MNPKTLNLLIGMPESGAPGGINACEPPFVAALRTLGHSVTEAVYLFDHAKRQTKPQQRFLNVLQTARKFRRLVQTDDFDVLHLNTTFELKSILRDAATVAMLPRRRPKIFLKMHGSDAELFATKSLWQRKVWQNLLEKAAGIGVLSGAERQNFIAAGINENKVFTVKNALELPVNLPPREFDGDSFRLLFVSRFVATKGLLDTIRAAAILRDKHLKFQLDCLGDGEIRADAEKLTADLKLQDHVRFHGYVSETEVAGFYQNSDLLIFPTYHIEGFPMVIFGAIAHGLPVITTKIRAAADYLREPENVLWTEPQNPIMLAEKICEIIPNKDLRRKISENNRAFSQTLKPENIAREFLEIYRQILG